MSRSPWMLAVGLLLGPAPATAGEVEGVIELPARPQNSRGASLYGKYRSEETHVATGGFAVVYLKPRSGSAPFVSRPVRTMDQNGIRFVPRVIPVQAGGQVRFLNSDPLYHNVFSLSPAKKFDLGRHPKGKDQYLTFDTPGVVQVFCDIHPQMAGFVVVVESPYYTVLEADGRYRISDVAPGEYDVKIWAEGMTRFDTVGDVTVSSSGSTRFTATMEE